MADEAEKSEKKVVGGPKKGLPRTKPGNDDPKAPKITFTKVKYLEDDKRKRWKKGQVVEFHTPTAASQIELGLAKYESGTKIKTAKKAEDESED